MAADKLRVQWIRYEEPNSDSWSCHPDISIVSVTYFPLVESSTAIIPGVKFTHMRRHHSRCMFIHCRLIVVKFHFHVVAAELIFVKAEWCVLQPWSSEWPYQRQHWQCIMMINCAKYWLRLGYLYDIWDIAVAFGFCSSSQSLCTIKYVIKVHYFVVEYFPYERSIQMCSQIYNI